MAQGIDYMMHDKNGNVIIDHSRLDQGIDIHKGAKLEPGQKTYLQSNEYQITKRSWSLIGPRTRKIWADFEERLEKGFERELEEKEESEEIEEEQKEPQWHNMFTWDGHHYFVCPICAAMISTSMQRFRGPDGVERTSMYLHEHWHKTVACDWYQD